MGNDFLGEYSIDHATFGGVYNNFDFDGHHTLKSMADRIISDLAFDAQCKRNLQNRRNKE